MTVTADDAALSRAANVCKFLLERQKRRTSTIPDLRRYPQVLWMVDIPEHPAITSQVPEDSDTDPLLVLERIDHQPPPATPPALVAHLDEDSVRDWDGPGPRLRSNNDAPDRHQLGSSDDAHDPYQPNSSDDAPDPHHLRARHAGWFDRWRAWAEEQAVRADVIEIYRKLYAVHQELRANAEQYEFVLASGYLTGPSGLREIRRHLLVEPVTVDLDAQTGRLTVCVAADAELRLEQEMLDSKDAGAGQHERVAALLADAQDPLCTEAREALHAWTVAHGPTTSYLDQVEPHDVDKELLRVSFAPAFILRERTRRSYVEAFATLEKLVRDGGRVPAALRDLVAPSHDRAGPDWDGGDRTGDGEADTAASSSAGADELYFPAPSNEQQRRIVDRLRHDKIVVVQGPPGTGKTHTIANLITDMMAHGKRVLVTSHTERALEELRGKLPQEIQNLCVSMASEHGRGQRQLEQSVQTLLSRLDQYDERSSQRERARLGKRLADARTARARAGQRLREIRENETYRYEPTYGDYAGTAAQIAERLRAEKDELGWLGPVRKKRAALTAEQALTFLRLLRAATPELRRLAGRVPAANDLMPPEEFAVLVERHSRHEAEAASHQGARESPQFGWLSTLDPAQRSLAASLLTAVEALLPQVDTRAGDRFQDAVAAAWKGSYRLWQDRRDRVASDLGRVHALFAQFDGHQITGLEDSDRSAMFVQVSDLRDRLASGRKLTGPLGLKSRPLKNARPLLDRVRVDGSRLDRDPRAVEAVWALLCCELALRQVEEDLGLTSTGSPGNRAARLTDEHDVLQLVVALGDALAALATHTRAPFRWDRQSIEAAQLALRALAADDLRAQVGASREPMRRALQSVADRSDAPSDVHAAIEALDTWDPKRYTHAYEQMEAVRSANSTLAELSLARSVIAAAHPELTARIEGDPNNPDWDGRLARLVDAWNWSVWDTEIRDLADPQSERRLLTELDQAERDERQSLRDLAANLAWDRCLRRISPADRLHLNGYVGAVKRIGKTGGKYVNRHRASAREHLQGCQHAVPAWIMPLYRVADTIAMDQPNPFDVVVIDEASQSGPEATLLLWLAPQIVVVGDDQQVSPEEVGQDRGEIAQLIDTYLADVPARSLFQVGSSFFDLAKASARTVKLLEHFRCMPEIIAFSNRECYGDELLPLRQYGHDRLEPLRHTYVDDAVVRGRASGSIVNEAEADALVETIVGCCKDPAYAGRTMGVITLQGNMQHKVIQNKLMQRLTVTEIEKRRLRVGNPESFQGAERDVIFLSLVAARDSDDGPRRIAAQTRADALRRFNVAVSRARDQVWLFHSVHLGDLSPEDLRYKYLEFVSSPPDEQQEIALTGVTREVRVTPFDSLFEQRVYLDLRARGYRVRPQYPALGYYIDLVVEGGSSRLAVECDGDAFHGEDRADYDGARQRDLERVGWTFWRVRASTYSHDPVQALAPLWRLLDERGIHPAGTSPASSASTPAPPASAKADPPNPGTSTPRTPPTVLPTVPQAKRSTSTSPAHLAKAKKSSHTQRPQRRAQADSSSLNNSVLTNRQEPETSGTASATHSQHLTILPAQAHRRLCREQDLLRTRLEEPPPVAAVDRAAATAQLHDYERARERYTERLDYLDNLLASAGVHHRSGRSGRIYPGCLLQVRDTLDGEPYIVTIAEAADPDAGYEAVSPGSPLGKALQGAVVGRSVSFTTPAGQRTLHILTIMPSIENR